MDNKKRKNMDDQNDQKRVKKECSYGEKCYRRNPAHFRECSHAHLESILDEYPGTGDFPIPDKFRLERRSIEEQLQIILENKFYNPGKALNTKANEGPPTEESIKTNQVQDNVKDITDRDKESLINRREGKNRESRSKIKDDNIVPKADDGSSKSEVTSDGDVIKGDKDGIVSKQSGGASSSQVKVQEYGFFWYGIGNRTEIGIMVVITLLINIKDYQYENSLYGRENGATNELCIF